jgi:NADH dehydrogenase [ubiquinone] 1 alpha subcomplex assembly factor 7
MSSSLIRTDLQEHLDWIESQRPSFDPRKPPDFDPDPSGIVKRDLTESIINLTDMYDPRLHTSLNDEDGRYELATPLCRELEAYIAVRAAPISVAEYMRQALTHPVHGYYTNPTSNSDDDWDNQEWEEGTATPDQFIIGSKGDFVTAPEVSQVFGECICVWFVTQWQAMGKPKELQIVELGPGKGTLISDICRSAMTSFTDFGDSLQKIHLVEASDAMRSQQERKLQELSNDHVQLVFETAKDSVLQYMAKETVPLDASPAPEQDTDKRTILVRWHDSFASVMRESSSESLPTLVLCQEFIDALPVHVFEKTKDGWRERMVDIASRIETDDDSKDSKEELKMEDSSLKENDKQKERMLRLRYVLSPDTTPALRTLLNVSSSGKMENDNSEVGSVCEVCPQGILLAQDIAQLLSKTGGSALIFDYGQEGSTDSIRAFSRHEQVPALSRPGQVDVTADVDFAALRHVVNARAQRGGDDPHAFGPVSQGKFLASMGIVERVSGLIEDDDTTDEQAEDLYHALERLVLPEHMGERYKVMAIAKKKEGIFGPPGF